MAENSKIEWTHHTFNPWEGCTKVGPGCDHCYAEAHNKRFHGDNWGPGAPRRRTSPANWKMPLKWNREAIQNGVRYRVFCASLADWLDNEIEIDWLVDLLNLIRLTPNLDWLLLTKRIGNFYKRLALTETHIRKINTFPNGENLFDFIHQLRFNGVNNVWVGATIVNQAEADRDVPKLLLTPAKIRFLSIEPLLDRISLDSTLGGTLWIGGQRGCVGQHHGIGTADCPRELHHHHDERCRKGIDWVIVGGESGKDARPMHPEWARNLRDQCVAARVPFLFKQWGEWAPHGTLLSTFKIAPKAKAIRFHQYGNGEMVSRFGKKSIERVLDGKFYNEYPLIKS